MKNNVSVTFFLISVNLSVEFYFLIAWICSKARVFKNIQGGQLLTNKGKTLS